MTPPVLRRLSLLALVLATARVAGAATPPFDMHAFILGIPKAELHIHFEGTLEPEQYLALARRNHLPTRYATADAVRARLCHGVDLPTFIEVYEELQSVLRTREDFRDVALAYFTRVRAQGLVYAEMFVDPQMHTTHGIPLATVLDGLRDARAIARARLGVRAEYILCFNRDRSAASAMEILEASRPWFDCIVGIGLDNPEVRDFPQKFAPVYARARALGLHLTSHCDPNQPDTIAHHWACLNLLHVERIDHGVNVLDDPQLIETVRDRHIGLTVCMSLFYPDPDSLRVTRAMITKRMLDLGLLVTMNSDDPGMMRSGYIGDSLLMTQATAHLTRAEVITLVKNAFRIAWLSDADRRAYLASIDAFAAQHPGPDDAR